MAQYSKPCGHVTNILLILFLLVTVSTCQSTSEEDCVDTEQIHLEEANEPRGM